MRKMMAALVLSALVLVLSGCVFTKPEASLYRLPKLSGEYESLESQIDALLSSGAEYAAPTSGSNLQSVQMIDLDGDGDEEAVAFFRRANDKKPMKIYIFKACHRRREPQRRFSAQNTFCGSSTAWTGL